MSIGLICREYRMKHGVPLAEIAGKHNYKTLSAFEMGRSSNMDHLVKYIKLSIVHGDSDQFMLTIVNEVQHNG